MHPSRSCIRRRAPHPARRSSLVVAIRAAGTLVVSALVLGALACAPSDDGANELAAAPTHVRVATFNIFELGESKLDEVDANGAPTNAQVLAAAAIIREIRPDIILLNEIDAPSADPSLPARRFVAELLATGADSIQYPYIYSAPTNTGELSGFDLNHDGIVATAADLGTRAHGDDSWGFGTYPGQYGMAILSRYPIDTAAVRTFRLFPWTALPNAHIPEGWFADSMVDQVRLSSKSHWDVPVRVAGETLHLLASHPTPPGFDGDEDRNGRRNYDEVGFWTYYLDNHAAIHDDLGIRGGLPEGAPFVILGDLNAPPDQPDSHYTQGTEPAAPAIMQLLRDARIQDPKFVTGRPTAFFRASTRADYVLPAASLRVLDGGVVWPDSIAQPEAAARAALASDHRMVWLDLALPFSPRD